VCSGYTCTIWSLVVFGFLGCLLCTFIHTVHLYLYNIIVLYISRRVCTVFAPRYPAIAKYNIIRHRERGTGKKLFYYYYYYYYIYYHHHHHHHHHFCLRLNPKTNLRPGNLSTRTRLRDAPQAFGTAARGNEIKQMPLANNCSAQTTLYALYILLYATATTVTVDISQKPPPRHSLSLRRRIVCPCHDCRGGAFVYGRCVCNFIRFCRHRH